MTGMSEELALWLLDQLTRDEHRANMLSGDRWAHGAMDGFGPCVIGSGLAQAFILGLTETSIVAIARGEDANLKNDHIAAWNPARALQECAAKRQVIEQYRSSVARHAYLEADLWDKCLRIVAQPYQWQQGYREDWRP
jgi:hypothetical protein